MTFNLPQYRLTYPKPQFISNAQAFFITLLPPSYSAPVGSVLSAYLHGTDVDPGPSGIPSTRTSPCSFSDSVSPMPQQVTRQWWPMPRHGLPPGCSSGDSDNPTPTCVLARVLLKTLPTIMSSIHSPLCLLRAALLLFWLLVAAFPTSLQQPQHPQHSYVYHLDIVSSWPSGGGNPPQSPNGGHFFDVTICPKQGHPRHFWCVTCTCSNCASGTNSMATNTDKSWRKEQHNCPYPNCFKVASYILAHIGLHTGELDHPKPCTERDI